MPTSYNAYTNATNTTSTTTPMFNISTTTTTPRRTFIYDVVSGSDATPADNAAKFSFRRTTARSGFLTTVTPNAEDAASPASLMAMDTTWSATLPTITASSDLLQWAQNQRATFRWVAAPGSELVIPATSSAGIALMSVVASATANYAWTVMWTE